MALLAGWIVACALRTPVGSIRTMHCEGQARNMGDTDPALAATTGQSLPLQLRHLEAQSIEIMREVVAEFKRPVMLYSIGKDSSVMLHLAMKAFYPGALPFPLLH